MLFGSVLNYSYGFHHHLRQGLVVLIGLHLSHSSYNVHALENLSENGIAAVKEGRAALLKIHVLNVLRICGNIARTFALAGVYDIELAAVCGSGTRVCIRNSSAEMVKSLGDTAVKLLSPYTASAVSRACGSPP